MSRVAPLATASTLLLAGAIVLSISVGSEPVSLARVLADPESLDRTLVVSARLPRVLLAALAGGGLSVVGAAFQALLRNPLADPYILGVSGGAAFGATVAIALGLTAVTTLGVSLLPFAAFAGGLASTALVYFIARRGGPTSGTSILLAGVIVNALASALITLLKTLVSASRAQELLFWLTGFLDVPTPLSLAVVATYVLGGSALLIRDAGRMNLLALGEASATHLGVDLPKLERRVFFACSAVVGAIVSVTGLIGFVGLCVPHLLRRLCGPDHRALLPLSFVVGAAALVLCDAAARLSFRALGTEPPVGAVTALIGGPVFLLLLARRQPGLSWPAHGHQPDEDHPQRFRKARAGRRRDVRRVLRALLVRLVRRRRAPHREGREAVEGRSEVRDRRHRGVRRVQGRAGDRRLPHALRLRGRRAPR